MNQYTENMRVLIRGVMYDSVRDAAEALGVDRTTIYVAMNRGSLDTVGLGKGRTKKVHLGGKPRKFTMAGVEFPSMAAASRALGFSKGYLRDMLRKPNADHQKLQHAMLAFAAKRENAAMRAHGRGE